RGTTADAMHGAGSGETARRQPIRSKGSVGISFGSELCDLDKLSIGEGGTFYHIGWTSDFADPRYNLKGQLKNVEYAEKAALLAAACSCDTFVSIGSQAECGRINGAITPHTPSKPETAYAIAKVVLNEKVRGICEERGMKFCSPRLLSGYGPFDRPATMIM
ncbi:MAG: NAD-dependent epimerase/dehydratase family protein, partial [Clostridia bacterium]|nr:NAD-dependent epimerase/dehydratase family protein [Clostridia bacterium]